MSPGVTGLKVGVEEVGGENNAVARRRKPEDGVRVSSDRSEPLSLFLVLRRDIEHTESGKCSTTVKNKVNYLVVCLPPSHAQ